MNYDIFDKCTWTFETNKHTKHITKCIKFNITFSSWRTRKTIQNSYLRKSFVSFDYWFLHVISLVNNWERTSFNEPGKVFSEASRGFFPMPFSFLRLIFPSDENFSLWWRERLIREALGLQGHWTLQRFLKYARKMSEVWL